MKSMCYFLFFFDFSADELLGTTAMLLLLEFSISCPLLIALFSLDFNLASSIGAKVSMNLSR